MFWTRLYSRSCSAQRNRQPNRARLHLEALEDRRLLSASLVDLNLSGTASGNNAALESRDAGGVTQGDRQRLTPDGRYVAFESPSSDLVDPSIDVNGGYPDVFVRDRQGGTTRAASVIDGQNVTGDDVSDSPRISPDGRWVVFESVATNLEPGDPNVLGNPRLYLRDLQGNHTILLGPGIVTTEGGNDAVFSSNSQFVAYTSARQIYERNLGTGTTTLVSVTADGSGPTIGTADSPAISADGRFVAFRSVSQDLVPNFVNAFSTGDIYLRDMQSGTTTVITHNGNLGGNFDSYDPQLSDDGKTLIFVSSAFNLGLNDSNTNLDDVFAYNVPTGTLSFVDMNQNGTGPGNSSALHPVLSANGRYVAFESASNNLTANDGDSGTSLGEMDVFVRDLLLGKTALVSVNSSHTHSANAQSDLPSISADGRKIAFESRATDLAAGFVKNNGSTDPDVYVYDQVTGNVTLLSSDRLNPAGSGDWFSGYPIISGDGSVVIFQSTASNLDVRDTGPETDVFFAPTDGSGGGGGTAQPGTLQFGAATYAGHENSGGLTITVTRTGGSDGAVTVAYATHDGTAVAGTQYTATVNTLNFGAGQASATFTVPLIHNPAVTDNTTFTITLSNATGGATLGSPTTAVVTVYDDDLLPWQNSAPSAKLVTAATAFAHSREHYTQFVVNAYQQYLKRTPDDTGLNFWVSAMLAGTYTDERVEAFFIGSDEYIANHGGPGAAWVTGMYKDLLGRTPADAEVQSWVNVLNGGTPASAVAFGFAASRERESQRVRFNYQTYLGRDASQAEVDLWVNAFVGGTTNEDMVGGFVGSPEYYQNPNKGQGNEVHWIARAYQDVLFRSASVDEVNLWLQFLG
jgi:Tol biopolymer transport system component